jgi:iron complex transport system permease protein
VSRKKVILLILAPLLVFFFSLFLGRYPLEVPTLFKILAAKLFFIPVEETWTKTAEIIVVRIRFPRALMAMLAGAGLSISGAAFQGMFHNPLVSPYLLGVSAGAGFGAALGIMVELPAVWVQVSAFLFGMIAVSLTYFISRVYKTTPVLMLVLSGVVVSSLFMALISLIKYTADPDNKLPAIVFWLMGSLGNTHLQDLETTIPPMLLGGLCLILVRWRVNLLSMGDREARAMGVNTEILKGIIITGSTLVSAAAVSICGIIGWVGLVIPHVCRMMVGPDHRVLLPTTLSVGAIYLLLIDDLARTITAAEIPLGILTAIIGAPFFAFLLRKTRGGWM